VVSKAKWTWLLLVAGAAAGAWTTPRPARAAAAARLNSIDIEAVPVPLYPLDPSKTTAGDFRYAGGLVLRSSQTDLMHELSDIVITGDNRFAAVGDGGVLVEGRLVLDDDGRLVGVKDGTLVRLLGMDGQPLAGFDVDAEGLALLPSGDRLVSFERHHRIWRYSRSGGLPRGVPSPPVSFPSNEGMEALTTEPDLGTDVYLVGVEATGETWTCRIRGNCVKGETIDKPKEFGLSALNHVADGTTACLLRAYDPVHRNRIIVKILRGTTVIARMDIAPPMTVDNFEGMTSVPAGNGRRFYLISDDNARASQRTLLFAFDWQPR
jgi:hypothetical protein